jgi:methylmalonyl-CoA mutase N-terminal domain/subunit
MSEPTAQRTLVKSPPELWAEVSDPESLARHLGGFGEEIKITRVEPETTVAWEGERARGTDNLLPFIHDALRDRCSLGEVCGAMRDVFGEYHPEA